MLKLNKNIPLITYLSNLQETQSLVWHQLGKNGELGYDAAGTKIINNGIPSAKGLSTHALTNKDAFITYEIEEKYETLKTRVAINDTVGMGGWNKASSPLTFSVIGDGNILWKSRPLQKSGDSQECEVNVSNVKKLTLNVFCTNEFAAHAIWIDPYLIAKSNNIDLLLNSSEWPEAINDAIICDTKSDEEKNQRAEAILDIIVNINLKGLKFLDFGCGEGHVVSKSLEQSPKLSIGYDIVKSEKWVKDNYTTDWEIVKKLGPYNVILMYDVIDHIISADEELINKLKEIKALLIPNGKIYVRTHPWCSRHATHIYNKLNKAFVHLVFTPQELSAMGYTQEKIRIIKHPLQEYNDLFSAAELVIYDGPHISKEEIEPFFTNNPLIEQKIKAHYKDSPFYILRDNFPIWTLECQFIDYILQNK